MADGDDKEQPIIIKKINKGGHGHHGGAWKVAYADFVTAMMAFFLLMWLLNATTEEQKNAISHYFDPSHPKVSSAVSGAGGLLAGQSVSIEGAMVTSVQQLINQPLNQPADVPIDRGTTEGPSENPVSESEREAELEEQARFDDVEEQIKQAIQDDPELQELASNLIIDQTPEGLRVQIVDQEGQSMFPSGSSKMFNKMRNLLQKMANILAGQPNKISVRGHTDGVPLRGRNGYSNWELSTDRAHSSRNVLTQSGYPEGKVHDVVGKADNEHLLPDEPNSPRNRRISIILLKEAVRKNMETQSQSAATPRTYQTPRRSNAIIDFNE